MSLVAENAEEFDRHSCRYKQFKIRNSRRTSTPQPLVRPKYIRRNIQCDLKSPPMQTLSHPPSGCPDVDTTYVSYVQWRHYLVASNSTRKFQVRCIGTNLTFRFPDTIISGHINMSPIPYTVWLPATSKGFDVQLKSHFNAKTGNIQDLLNSTIIDHDDYMAGYREHLERRNRRILNVIVPMIKKTLKSFIAEPKETVEPVRNKSTKFLSSFNPCRRERSEDLEYLKDYFDVIHIEE